MKVAAVSMLCQDARAFDAMWRAGTPCPYNGQIGDDAKQAWLDNPDDVPLDSVIFKKRLELGVVNEYVSPDDYSTEERITEEPSEFAWIPGILLSLVCLLSFLVFHPSPSNAQQGVNSNTITSGVEVTTITGESTSEIVTNEDGSETTTTTTPITTITTTTTVTQTEVDNVVQNPNFTNEFGGGSSTDWNLESCGGDGCRFELTHGFMTSFGEGSISQTHSANLI